MGTNYSCRRFLRICVAILLMSLGRVVADEPAATPTTQAAFPADLLADVDLSTDVIHGKWSKSDGGIECKKSTNDHVSVIRFCEIPHGDYSYEVSYTLGNGHRGMHMIAGMDGHDFTYFMPGTTPTLDTFSVRPAENFTIQYEHSPPGTITKGRHTSRLVVHQHTVACYFDGKLAFTATLNAQGATSSNEDEQLSGYLGLATVRAAKIHSATLTVGENLLPATEPASVASGGAAQSPPAGGSIADSHQSAPSNPTTGPSPAPTVVPARPIDPDATVRPALRQSTINALEIAPLENGMMVGQTSEVTLTLSIGPGKMGEDVRVEFIGPAGSHMRMAADDAERFIHLTYSKWTARRAEITFEDRDDIHDGGSIGTAIGCLILSCINGISIDPAVAITGDISANGRTRAIGGVGPKIKGAVAGHCKVVVIPLANQEQFVDAVVYHGPRFASDIQVLGVKNLDEAIATVRSDRDPKLAQAIDLFSEVQKTLKSDPTALKSAKLQATLTQILQLAPQHLSAQILLDIAQGKAPLKLSPEASEYYAFVSFGNMMQIVQQRGEPNAVRAMPSGVIRDGISALRNLRRIADPNITPLIDVLINFTSACDSLQEGSGSKQAVERARQALVDELARLDTNVELIQKMLKEGV